MEQSVPKIVELLVEKNSAELRLYVKEEVERSRVRAIAAFTAVAALVAFLSSLGIYQLLKGYIDNSVARVLQDESTRRAFTRIRERSTQADKLLIHIAEVNNEAIGRLDQIKGAAGSIGMFRIASGRTNPDDWKANGEGITVLVDTSSGGFSEMPIYLVTLVGGGENAWAVTGATSIYGATPSRFKIFIRLPFGHLSPDEAKKQRWSIQWVGLEPVALKASVKP
jgi:hypothetical protein